MGKRRSYGKIEKVRKGAERSADRPSMIDARVTPTSRSSARPIPMRQEQKGGKLITYVNESIQHGEIIAAGRGGSSYYSPGRGCVTKGGKDPMTGKAVRGAPRRGQVDLIFAPRNIPAGPHSKRPPPPGPAIRFCGAKGGFGPVLPVKDPREARKIVVAYQTCMRDPKKKVEACVESATGGRVKDMAFGDRKAGRSRPSRPEPRSSTAAKTFLFPWQRRS